MSARVFDARPDRVDFRDLPYLPPLRSLPERYPDDREIARWLPAYVRAGLILDQGTEGACTGFGLACVVNYLLWVRQFEARTRSRPRVQSVSPRMLYELAKRYDEWAGEDYDGSSCRGALKGWHRHGVCAASLWPHHAKGRRRFIGPKQGWERDALRRTLGVYYRVDRRAIVDMQAALVNIGALYVSGQIHRGWDRLYHQRGRVPPRSHRDIPDIDLVASPLSGHAFALVGYDARGFIVQNSWGRRFGASGFARLSYHDWLTHGTDVWACAVGVPAEASSQRVEATKWWIPSGPGLATGRPGAARGAGPSDDPWPINHEFEFTQYEPLSTARAYQHTLVTGNDGEICIRDVSAGNPAEYAKDIVLTRPGAWLRRRIGAPKLVIYAHGGLNGEDESIKRVRLLGPYFLANDIYPIFVTWRTGPGETLADIVSDWVAKIPGIGEARAAGLGEWLEGQKDRAIETIGRPFGRGIWSEMRENAERSTKGGHGLAALAENLHALASDIGRDSLQVHLIGHSAGAILLGHLLETLGHLDVGQSPALSIASCTLFAPACSVEFANARYIPASTSGLLPLTNLWLHVLSDANEKRDGLPTAGANVYGKSLLYLVSRALDDARKMPILGLERAQLSEYSVGKRGKDQWAEDHLADLQTWQAAWQASGGRTDRTSVVVDETVLTTRANGHAQATHGSFDNNISLLTATIERIRGRPLESPMEWLDY